MIANDDLCNLGRLGNQMFQYASLRGIAAKHKYDYCLPPNEVLATRDANCANSDINLFTCFNIPSAPRLVTNFRKVRESSIAFDENLWEYCPDNVSLYGYFLTERYFKHIEAEIRNAFVFVDQILIPTKDWFNRQFKNTEVISIHIRRGDYLDDPNHVIQPINYYSEALNCMPKDIPVLIFSDGIEWCRQQELFQSARFMFSENNGTGIDLCLQSLCSYHVIANSTYSWWGAWLANSRKTIAPSNWVNKKFNLNTEDIFIDKWTVL